MTPLSRRELLALAAAGAATAALGSPARALAIAAPSRARKPVPFRLGVCSYSLRNFPRERMIEMVKALGTPYVNLKSFHLPYELSPAEIAAARAGVESAGLTIAGGGTITFDVDSDEGVARYFEYARAAGMPLIVATMDPTLLPRVERHAKRYDIRVAIHNHGPEDRHFPSPYDVLKTVRGLDRRVGLCIDVGHTVRTGTDVVRAARDAGGRLLDLHAKDLRDLKDEKSQCIVGEGAIPFPALFRQLAAMGYAGCVNLEYEIEPDDPLAGMQRSMAYMRGVAAGIAAG
jgi:sugar phosphate isomerase/epimerase